MRSHVLLIVHRERLVAEGLAISLERFSALESVGVATTVHEARSTKVRVACAIDSQLPGAEELAAELRSREIRVVLIGRPTSDKESLWLSTAAPLSELAVALFPLSQQERTLAGTLTEREHQIIELVARGLPGKQVATHLGISPKTVEQHKTRIFAKLGVSNQTAAVSWMLGGYRTRLVASGSRNDTDRV